MAFRRRIRHKLMLGLGLVVGIIALLLTGTYYGLASYRSTMRSIESKLVELTEAVRLKAVVKSLLSSANNTMGTPDEMQKMLALIHDAREALDAYELKLDDTLTNNRDPEKGYVERRYVEVIRRYLSDLERETTRLKSVARVTLGPSTALMSDPGLRRAIDNLMGGANDLELRIFESQGKRIVDAREYYRTSLITVISVSVGGVVLLCSLLRFFYRWVFYPIRDLEAGAGRIAQGDFDFRIDVHSGDEMEDLAAAFNDMTARLRDMYGDLERQVNDRSRQLVRSERLASVGFLAAGVAHEINNPLASIAFCSEALEQRLRERTRRSADETIRDDENVIAKYLKMIQEEAFRCKSITQRLLEFSRGGERLREPANLGDVIQAVLDMVEHLENGKGKHVVFQPTRRVTAWVNAQEIKSVVLNLVVNALDSMDAGGTLTITLTQRAGMAIMEFADTGCGMPEEVLENIFEPFYTRSRTGKGTGLGLSISHRIINQHGGEIEADSAGLNQGSTFTVCLPLQPAEPVKEDTLGNVAA